MDPQETKGGVGETAAVRRSGGGRSNRSNAITPATCASLGSSLVVRRAVAKNVVGGGVSGNANWLCSAGTRAQLGMHAESARQVSSRRAGSRFALWQQHTPARLQHANAQARSPRLSTGSRLARSGANSANNPSWTNAKHKARDNRRGSVDALVHRTTDLHQEFSRLVPRSCIVLGIQRNTQASSPGYSLRIEAASLRRLSLRGPHFLGETYSTPERFHNSLVYRSKPTIFHPQHRAETQKAVPCTPSPARRSSLRIASAFKATLACNLAAGSLPWWPGRGCSNGTALFLSPP